MSSTDGKNTQNHQMAIKQEDEEGISVPNWLIDVLKWITRIEMANCSLSYSCRMFKQLCWPKLHGDVKSHIVPYLKFCNDLNEFGNFSGILKKQVWQCQHIPIAAISPPEYILGFEQIIIGFMDDRIIEFAKNLANERVNLSVENFMPKLDNEQQQITLIGQLLTLLANNIYEIDFANYTIENSFSTFYSHFSAILDQLPRINMEVLFDSDPEILFNWLMKQRADGSRKILSYHIHFDDHQEMSLRFVNRIKEEFSSSTETKNFLIVIIGIEYENVSLKNEFTGEVLNLYTEMDPHGLVYTFLARYPEREEQQWKNENITKITAKGHIINISLEMEEFEDMKNNKFDVQKCFPDLTIADNGFVVASSDNAHGYNTVYAKMRVKYQHYCLSRLEKYIACYFEVKILKQCDIGIGFCQTHYAHYALSYKDRGELGNSMGFWRKDGISISGTFKPFDKAESNELFSQGDVIGCGLLHSRNISYKFFATHNGILLGLIELPSALKDCFFYPTVTLATPSASIRANFGKEAFCFDRSTLFKRINK